jgi:hypothetical protein
MKPARKYSVLLYEDNKNKFDFLCPKGVSRKLVISWKRERQAGLQ